MSSILNFSNISHAGFGHWIVLPSGKISYMLGNMHANHPHKKIHDTTSNIKGIKKISVHGMELEHYEDGSYKVGVQVIKHGKLDELSSSIQKELLQNAKTIHSKINGHNCKTIIFKNSSIKLQIIDHDNYQLFVLREANHHPVSCHIKRTDGKEKSDENLIKFAAEYLAHENHRTSLAIHGNGIISHAPDHIMFNMSPIKYWPSPQRNLFFRTPDIAFE